LNRLLSTGILLLLSLLAGGTQAIGGNPGSSPAHGADVALADWASTCGLRFSWNPRSRDIVLTGSGMRFQFHVDSSRVIVDDTSVWLSHPVQVVRGQVVVASRDIRGVLKPLVQPPRLPAGRRLRTICLDAGHGGKEPGLKSGAHLEKGFTLELAQEVRKRLVSAGFRVVMTRSTDTYVDLAERTAIARREGADILVSLHFNAAPTSASEAGGVEVYALTPEGARSTNVSNDTGPFGAATGNASDAENLLLAYSIQKSLVKQLPGIHDRGVRRARFLVLRLAEMPAVLVEAGFMSNPDDARWIYSATGRGKTAQAIVDGIRAYQRFVQEDPASPPTRRTAEEHLTRTLGAAAKK
jgi:N-acetylmuramoyl-L-alanine amidase